MCSSTDLQVQEVLRKNKIFKFSSHKPSHQEVMVIKLLKYNYRNIIKENKNKRANKKGRQRLVIFLF
jgi:hypothetical protein